MPFVEFVTAIRGITEIAEGLKSLHDFKQVAEASSQLLQRLLTVESEALSLHNEYSIVLQQKSDLEKRLLEFEKWDDTASQYSLKKLVARSFVYVPNETNKAPKPMHYLCAKCYGDRKKSILQTIYVGTGGDRLFCPECKTRYEADSDDIRELDS